MFFNSIHGDMIHGLAGLLLVDGNAFVEIDIEPGGDQGDH